MNQMKPQWNSSPWCNNAEIGDNVPVIIPGRSPIKYPTIWEREREILCYNPRFLPNTVTFDRKNRPVIRVGVHDVVGKHATVYYSHVWVKEVFIQTLDAAGKWIVLSLSSIMKEKIEDWNDDQIASGVSQAEERIVFDASGDAYTIVKTKTHGDFLFHSRDDMENWEVHPLPVSEKVIKYRPIYRIERTASDRPPVIFVLGRDDVLSIIAPKKKDNGTLNNLNLIDELRIDNVMDGPSHSGVGDQTVTVANKTHIVYVGTIPVEGKEGTPQYIVTYNHDHDDQPVTGPVLLGVTQSSDSSKPIDHHNGPAIVSDSQGFLHVVLGSHQKPFKYTVSKRPNDATEWKLPVEISNPSGKETYVSLVIDKADTLHLVSRMVDDEGYSLHYMRKKRNDDSWSDFGKLAVPKPKHYSVWYHKLTIDGCGRLFLAYFYYSHKLTDDELDAYHRKWPDEELEWNEDDQLWETNAHDPVILVSSDSGYSWKIATTQDMITPWSWLTANRPEWSDANGWGDVANYSTIQTAVINNELYLLARANKGIQTWKFNAGNKSWSQLASNSPDWSDANGWGDVANYSTIQTAVINNELYLLARANKGIQTWKFNAGSNSWSQLASNSPEWSDADGWDDVANYSTIQAAVVNSELYLLARANKGIQTWKFNAGNKSWSQLASNSPDWLDADGWDDVANYSTIQAVVVNNELYLLARANKGIQTWKFNAGNKSWSQLASNSPEWSDTDGWDDVANYSTIQTVVVNNELYMLARANKGIQTWKFNAGNKSWSQLASNSPEWSDADGWSDVANYSTIQTAVVKNELYLLARADAGIQTWKFNTGNKSWSKLASNSPGWSDASGWDDVANYSTIQTAVVNNEVYLLARANAGIHTWKFNSET